MSFFPNLIKELRDRKLWPIAIGLIVALVAVPVLLSKKASTDLVTPQPTGGLPYSTGTTLPAISVQTTASNSKLPGRGRNPFTPQVVATTTTATTPTTTAATTPTPSTSTTSSGGSTGSGSSTGSTPAPSSSTPAPAPAKPAPAKPGPPSLTPTQSYEVSLAITDASGNLNTIDPLERLSILPSPQQPLLVEYGVLQGGGQVLFAVQPGAAVSGPGTCTPGPIDCEVLSLAPGQIEAVSKQTPTGATPVARFSINSITAAQHGSVAAANQARNHADEVGRKLLLQSSYTAISLFQYVPSVGAVVDLRNLTVGGN
ncbi:MAG TPA: hypothetical protein VME22_11765 [Solirubrobacteraceae bacterium]|nr:hypothetical protein [Solirubrobacteraceae bacterium]